MCVCFYSSSAWNVDISPKYDMELSTVEMWVDKHEGNLINYAYTLVVYIPDETGGVTVKSSRNIKWFQTAKFVEFDREMCYENLKINPSSQKRNTRRTILCVSFCHGNMSFNCITPKYAIQWIRNDYDRTKFF